MCQPSNQNNPPGGTICHPSKPGRVEKPEKSAKIKSRFLSTVAHELKIPLASMKESISLILDGIAGQINNEQKQILDITKRNIDRLNRLINNILVSQKPDDGKINIRPQKNNINEVVREAKETMQYIADAKGLNLTIKLDETVGITGFDKDKITQVLLNLVDNAVKFTDTGGITITTKNMGRTVRVSVQDTGRGIDKKDLPRVFGEFEQLHDSNDKTTEGVGLGLAISRKIIEQHNGKIRVDSKFDKGSTVSFILPKITPAENYKISDLNSTFST